MENKCVNIAILGIGTVGYATYSNFYKNRESIIQKTGIEINVTRILEKEPSLHKSRVRPDCQITNRFEDILQDESISIIVELMGGKTLARDFVLQALKKGKHVITANKALIAEYAHEIHDAVMKSSSSFYYEAAVAGGIPIIAAIQHSFAGNSIKKIQSIVNGTCNYILTEMSQKAIDFPKALEDAKSKGYAEADPTFDIEGIDAAHKISILSALAFGKIPVFKNIKSIQGISQVSIHDIRNARELGYEIKLIASTELTPQGLDVRVGPCMLDVHHPLASVEGVYNAVFVEADPVGSTMFYGRGAGGNPTSSAVIGDIISCATQNVLGGLKHPIFNGIPNDNTPLAEYGNPSRFAIRVWAEDKPGVLAKIAGVLGKYSISIATVIQKNIEGSPWVPVFITTHMAAEKNMVEASAEISRIKAEANLKESPFIMRILE